MPKLKIKITSTTDISKAIDNLKNECVKARISKAEQHILIENVESVVNDLVRRGRELSSVGSQFQVKRVIESGRTLVAVDVHFGSENKTLVEKLRSLFSKR